MEPKPILEFSEMEVSKISNLNVRDDNECMENVKIKIDASDIQPELDYWNSALICYIVGANPPTAVMEGFVRQIWRNMGVDKVAVIRKGIFIVRLTTMENRDNILLGNMAFFDSKPLIVKAWEPDMNVQKDDLTVIPIWIQLHLDFKYWGVNCWKKITSPIGKFLKTDQATEKRDKLMYARVMVEVMIDQDFPDQLSFINEKGIDVVFGVTYEWKPDLCDHCKKMGHNTEECRKEVRKQWRPKVQSIVVQPDTQPDKMKENDLQISKKGSKRKENERVETSLANSFAILSEMENEENVIVGNGVCGNGRKMDEGGGSSLVDHG